MDPFLINIHVRYVSMFQFLQALLKKELNPFTTKQEVNRLFLMIYQQHKIQFYHVELTTRPPPIGHNYSFYVL